MGLATQTILVAKSGAREETVIAMKWTAHSTPASTTVSSLPGTQPERTTDAGTRNSTLKIESPRNGRTQHPHAAASDGKTTNGRKTDADLIEQCLQGNRDAWTALIERYSGLIYSTAWQYRLPLEDVADVYQSVAVALLEGLGELRDRTKLNSWLTSVTIHECLRVKRRRAKAMASMEDVESEVVNIPDGSALPDEMVQRLEKQQLVRQALSMMDEPCRCLLTKLFFEKEQWSYEQIADELGLAVSTIGPKRGRCLRKLLQILTQLGLCDEGTT